MHARRAIIACIFVLLTASPAQGDDAPAAASRPDVGPSLGTPAEPEAIREAVERARSKGAAGQVELAHQLGNAGGVATIEVLRTLVSSRDESVQEAALEACGRVGLRSARLAVTFRRTFTYGSDRVRCALLDAMGVTGTGADVPWLLEVAAEPDHSPAVRRSAFRALRALSGERKPYSIPRWQAWWDSIGPLAQNGVRDALAELRDTDDPTRIVMARGVLKRWGWLQCDVVATTARDWLTGDDARLRGEACRMVEWLRLADLADEVEQARVFDLQGVYREQARGALEALGVPPEAPAREVEDPVAEVEVPASIPHPDSAR